MLRAGTKFAGVSFNWTGPSTTDAEMRVRILLCLPEFGVSSADRAAAS